MPSFKVGVKTAGDRDWCFNGLRFSTREVAETYTIGLALRWTAIRDVEVFESEDEASG